MEPNNLPVILNKALNEHLTAAGTQSEKKELITEAKEAWETANKMVNNHIQLDTTPEKYALNLFEAGVKLNKEIAQMQKKISD